MAMNSLRVKQYFKEKRTHKRLLESNSELKGSHTTLNKSNIEDGNYCNVDDVQYCQTSDVEGAYETEDDDGELHYSHSADLNYWTEPTVSEMEYTGDDDDNDDDYYYDNRDSTSSFSSKLQLEEFNLFDIINLHLLEYNDNKANWTQNMRLKSERLTNDNSATVTDFSSNFSAFCRKNTINQSVQEELLRFLKLNVPGLNWPVRNSRNDSFHSSIERYLEQELPLLKFHLCPEFWTAFVGIHRPLKFCPVCNAPRFTSRSDHLITGTPKLS